MRCIGCDSYFLSLCRSAIPSGLCRRCRFGFGGDKNVTLAYFLDRWSCLDPCNTSYNSSSSSSISSSLSDSSESDSGTINAEGSCRTSLLLLSPATHFPKRLGAAANAGALFSRFAYNEAQPFISPAKGISAVTSCRETATTKKAMDGILVV